MRLDSLANSINPKLKKNKNERRWAVCSDSFDRLLDILDFA